MPKRLRVVHASGDTFMKLSSTQSDVGHLLKLRPAPLWLTITETGELDTLHAIHQEILRTKAPYNLLNPDKGDISFLLHHDARLVDRGGPLAIPRQPGHAQQGGHGPRHNSWMELDWEDETIFANGVHFVTLDADHQPGGKNRADEQATQADLLGEQMSKQAHFRRIAIGSGDLNTVLPQRKDIQTIFDRYGMTTTAEETDNMTGTHGRRRIDYVWTMDKDGRVKVDHMDVLKNHKFESDHDPVVVDLTIR